MTNPLLREKVAQQAELLRRALDAIKIYHEILPHRDGQVLISALEKARPWRK